MGVLLETETTRRFCYPGSSSHGLTSLILGNVLLTKDLVLLSRQVGVLVIFCKDLRLVNGVLGLDNCLLLQLINESDSFNDRTTIALFPL